MNKLAKNRLGDLSGYLFSAPAAGMMLLFIVYGFISLIQISLTNWGGLGEISFVGLENYKQLLFDPIVWESIRHTFVWVFLSVVLLAIGSLVLALIIEFGIPFRKITPIFRTVLFMPMMMSPVAIGLMWTLIFNPTMGLLNELLSMFGFIGPLETIDFLGNYTWALLVAFIPVLWNWSGFGMVIFSAAIQGIPDEMLEASIVDGCSKLKQIKYIVLPLLKPTIVLVCTLNLVGAFKAFDLIYIMTAGGPGTATQVTSIYIFRQAFVNYNYGYSSAISIILFAITLIMGLVFFKYQSSLESHI